MRQDKKQIIMVGAFFIIPVVYIALAVAPHMSEGLSGIIDGLMQAVNKPGNIVLCKDSVKTVLIFLLIYAVVAGAMFANMKNYRRGEEHGSAQWGNAEKICKKYAQRNRESNKLLTQNVRIGLNGRKHRRNLNVLVCGGSGAGKTRFYCKPNIMQGNTSYVILDPKGEILRDTGKLLESKGYEIKVLDLINMEKSHCYNPFVYIHSDNDVQKLVNNLFKSTTPKGAQSQDPFWDTAASMLLKALIFYLKYEAPEDEQNFPMVMEMLRAGEVREDDEDYISPLDNLFYDLELKEPEHIAVRFYNNYKKGAGVVCSKRLLNQMIWKSLRTHNFTYRRKETKP